MAEEKKKLSVQEMLAAARANKGDAAAKPAEPAAEAPAEAAPAEAPAEKPKPAPKPAAASGAKPAGGKLSMAEMLAAARANKPAAESPKAPKPAAKPVEKPKPAAKAEPKKEAAAATAEKESGSFLAGGPSKDKPGPMTKAEAAAKESPAAKAGKAPKVAPPMPEKPAYARPPAAAGKGKVEDRRGFFAMALGTALGVGFTTMSATFGLWGLALARFMFPNVLREPPSSFKVGFKSDFPFGKVEEKFKAQYGVWVVNYEYNGQQEIYALSTVCTHLGCTPNWLEAEQKFKCPCHGSGFYKDGINFEGPAPRPLERYAIQIADDGQLQVDKSRKFQEEMGQWEDPASFVNT